MIMKLNSKLTFLLAAVGTAAAVVYFTRNVSARRRRGLVAEEGYETAQDILYPGKMVRGKLHYGPVLPE